MREEWGAQTMVKRMGVEHVTYRMEWKATILRDYEGSKCLPLVSRSCSDQHSIYLCFLFGHLCTLNLARFHVSKL